MNAPAKPAHNLNCMSAFRPSVTPLAFDDFAFRVLQALTCLPSTCSDIVPLPQGDSLGESLTHARTFAALPAARRGFLRPLRKTGIQYPRGRWCPAENALALHWRAGTSADRQGHRA